MEIVNVLEQYSEKVIDKIFSTFDLDHLIHPSNGQFSSAAKINLLIKTVKNPPPKGPFSEFFNLDLLQYLVDHFYRFQSDYGTNEFEHFDPFHGFVKFEDRFSIKYPFLANSLKRDGFIVKETKLKKMLPSEIDASVTESELFSLLKKFNFNIALGHLEQAISNHSQGKWAGANAQFRPFIESLLIDICKKLLPKNECDSASIAINLLSKTINPPFLRMDLNEVESAKCSKPFIEGFWKRLHPEGTHPGLSDEEDSTFRYHMTVVVAYYLLKRLSTRK